MSLQLARLYHPPADTLDLPVLALCHVLLYLGPGHGLVTQAAEDHVPGAVDHVQLETGGRYEPPAERNISVSIVLVPNTIYPFGKS